ncbi:MAG: RIP metalloprotease RseP [Duodenibacillus sp.]|nr:RIP metalloprotease RseP [Duodenibacillus sp.]
MLTIVGLILSISILVVVHEWGHYQVARWCGVPVLAFSVGFGTVLFRHRDKRGCEWRISAIPLGGYVKMLTLAERELNEADGLNIPEQAYRDAFETKSVFKRLAVVAAGPAMNIILAVMIYAGLAMLGTWEPVSAVGEPPAQTQAARLGVHAGWRIESVAESAVKTFNEAHWRFIEHMGENPVPVRFAAQDGSARWVDFDLSGFRGETQEDPMSGLGLQMHLKHLMVGTVFADSPASESGLAARDKILKVNGRPVTAASDLTETVAASRGSPIELVIETASGETRTVTLTPRMMQSEQGERWMIGVRLGLVPELVRVQQDPFGALAVGTGKVWDLIALTAGSIGKMLTGQMSAKGIAGPVSIGDMAGQSLSYGLLPFLSFLAMISVSLGFLNLLPVPVLDGGYIAAFLWEIATGRPVGERTVAIAQKIGMGLLGILMVFALTNDFSRLFGLN